MARNTAAIKRGWSWDSSNNTLDLYVNGECFLKFDPTNNVIYPGTDDTYSLGSSSYEFDDLYVDGTANIDTLSCTTDADLPSGCVDKADLASEVYTIEHITFNGSTNDFDNQTVKVSRVWSACTLVRVVYFTTASLGTGVGIDILDGGTAGTGTDVIDACSDALNGLDSNDLTTPHALSANDYICIKFDDVDASVDFSIDIQLKVPVATAT